MLGALFLAEGWAEPVPLTDDTPIVPFTANDPYAQRVLYPDHPPNLVHEIYPPYFSLLDRRAANRERAADASRRRRSRRRR